MGLGVLEGGDEDLGETLVARGGGAVLPAGVPRVQVLAHRPRHRWRQGGGLSGSRPPHLLPTYSPLTETAPSTTSTDKLTARSASSGGQQSKKNLEGSNCNDDIFCARAGATPPRPDLECLVFAIDDADDSKLGAPRERPFPKSDALIGKLCVTHLMIGGPRVSVSSGRLR